MLDFFRRIIYPVNQDFLSDIKKLNKIENINSGGCGLAAIAIYNIARSYNLSPQIVYTHWNPAEIKHKISMNMPTSANHVLVKVQGRYYDCTGYFTKSELEDKPTIVPIEILKKSVLDYRLWNSSFNRKYGITEINKINHIGIEVI